MQPSEIEAWARLSGEEISPWEFETLLRMDAAFLARLSKKRPDNRKVDVNDGKGVAALLRGITPQRGMQKVKTKNGDRPG